MTERALIPLEDGRERLLGAVEVRKLLGGRDGKPLSSSSLLRLWSERRAIPAPRKIGGKSVWRASDINAYGASLFADEVRALSVTNVDQLCPDEVEDTAFALAARALSARLGGTVVEPESVTISTTRPATPDETAQQLANLANKSPFAGLDLQSTFTVAAGLFPELRALWRQHPLHGKLMADSDAEALKRAQIVLSAASSRRKRRLP